MFNGDNYFLRKHTRASHLQRLLVKGDHWTQKHEVYWRIMSILIFLSTNMAIFGRFQNAVFETQKRGLYFFYALLFVSSKTTKFKID